MFALVPRSGEPPPRGWFTSATRTRFIRPAHCDESAIATGTFHGLPRQIVCSSSRTRPRHREHRSADRLWLGEVPAPDVSVATNALRPVQISRMALNISFTA